MISDRVIGCWSCGKPAVLVGDSVPAEFPLCFWCMAECRPGAAALFVPKLADVGMLICEVADCLSRFAFELSVLHRLGRFDRHAWESAQMCPEVSR